MPNVAVTILVSSVTGTLTPNAHSWQPKASFEYSQGHKQVPENKEGRQYSGYHV